MTDEQEKNYPIVVVEWVDSSSIEGWMDFKELQEWLDQGELVAYTVGMLVDDGAMSITVASSAHKSQVAQVMQIPRGAIRSMKTMGQVEV